MDAQFSAIKIARSKQITIEIICYAYIILFIYAGFYKILDFKFFRVSLENSPLIGGFAWALVYLVPVGEIIISFLLIGRSFRLIGLYLASLVMSGFSFYIFYLLFFSPNVPCHCGGILAEMGWPEHLIMNCCFVVLGIIAIILEKKRRKLGA